MPSYILVCDRNVSELELKAASEFNIPILIYHKKEVVNNQKQVCEVTRDKIERFDYGIITLDYVPNQIERETNLNLM